MNENRKDASMKKVNLSDEWRMIKSFARFGMVEFSNHSLESIKRRGLTKEDVLHILMSANSSIVQHHEPGEYNENKNPVNVVWGKVKGNKNCFLHVVLATEISPTGGKMLRVVTAYKPSKEFFLASGRVVKSKNYYDD